MPQETTPSAVPVAAQQDGEVWSRWDWAEPAVWTERMLTALQEGVKGGKWFRPNAFFAEQGLYSLAMAYASVRQSPRG